MQTFLAIACKQGYIINEYTDHAIGITGRNEEGKIGILRQPFILFFPVIKKYIQTNCSNTTCYNTIAGQNS